MSIGEGDESNAANCINLHSIRIAENVRYQKKHTPASLHDVQRSREKHYSENWPQRSQCIWCLAASDSLDSMGHGKCLPAAGECCNDCPDDMSVCIDPEAASHLEDRSA
eukprot:1161438-Pelagomonas_calceolata.AAC.2